MFRLIRYLTLFCLIVLIVCPDLSAQFNHVPSKERTDPTLRRRIEIDGNNVRTSVFNFAFSGRTGGGAGVPYEWPKNTNRYYVAILALFVGAEVTDDTGHIQRIVDLPAYRIDTRTNKDWNLNPIGFVNGVPRPYFNPASGKIAKSDEPETWPDVWPDKLADPQDPGWPGKWNGFFGKNQFNADQEVYARVGDDNYNRFKYTPDTTDATRGGLGLIIDYRALEWSQSSVSDAVFFIHEVKNDGTKDLKKTSVTLWLADFVGGDGDSQDDHPDFDIIQDIAFSFDYDGISSNNAFQGHCVGCAATLYLETPGNAEDRIDNDGDSADSLSGPQITAALLGGAGSFGPEIKANGIDDNHNGLVDEDSTYINIGHGRAVNFADGIDHNNTGESGSPVITQQMINQAQSDPWHRWPPDPENDLTFWPNNNTNFKQQSIHLIEVDAGDIGLRYKDNIDNDGNCDDTLPTVTQAMVAQAATDPYHRYRVPGTNVILYDVGPEDVDHKYLNKDGLRDRHIDNGINVMIDESRNDGIDNDGDWNPITDDVGLDGAPDTHDPGEGDGKPTSGVGTPFPGEPNVDKTDVSEADQIGLTNVQYWPTNIDFSRTADIFFWGTFMLPGTFVNPAAIPVGEDDLYVSSGLFPLHAGQIERISCAVVMGNAVTCPYIGDPDRGGAKSDALRKRNFAQLAYNEDYQFAQAPVEPTVTAVAGDKQVTLYWDDLAEQSFDRFLSGVPGANPRDFEGYKVFRATDPAFEDARIYRDGFGSPTPWLRALATFDLRDGIRDFFPVMYNGVGYPTGSDNGLQHTWTDTTVQNGQKYYYAVRAYDQGWAPLNIIPAESNLKISIDNVTGKVTKIGKSIAIVVPEASVAGYLPPSVSPINLVAGSTTGKFGYRVVDPSRVKDGHRYRVTFEDTITAGRSGAADTFKTKTYTLTDVTTTLGRLDTLTSRRRRVLDADEQPVADGFQLFLRSDARKGLDTARARINRSGAFRFSFTRHDPGFVVGQETPHDYRIVFSTLGADTSTEFLIDDINLITVPAVPVNFTVVNTETNAKVKFAFFELDPSGVPGEFSAVYDPVFPGGSRSDRIIILEKNGRDTLVTSWSFEAKFDSALTNFRAGDSVLIYTYKIFRSNDVFEFSTVSQKADLSKATQELDKIKVVPNPYVGAATWEERNPFATGRGPRSLHFNHLPQVCTIRIYTVSGDLVTTIQHNSTLLDGSEEWNLLTRDNLSVSYGVYIYHVEAPGVGEKIGKFAVIK